MIPEQFGGRRNHWNYNNNNNNNNNSNNSRYLNPYYQPEIRVIIRQLRRVEEQRRLTQNYRQRHQVILAICLGTILIGILISVAIIIRTQCNN
jgi:hypothetical protein